MIHPRDFGKVVDSATYVSGATCSWLRIKREYDGMVNVKMLWIEGIDDMYDDPPVLVDAVSSHRLPVQTRYMSDLHMETMKENLVFYPFMLTEAQICFSLKNFKRNYSSPRKKFLFLIRRLILRVVSSQSVFFVSIVNTKGSVNIRGAKCCMRQKLREKISLNFVKQLEGKVEIFVSCIEMINDK
jgi:hypothetical protein